MLAHVGVETIASCISFALSADGGRFEWDKLRHVSPFVPRTMRYRFRIFPPSDRLRVLEADRDGRLLAATFNGRRRALASLSPERSFVMLPLMTFKVAAAIHWEAQRLWLKGARVVPRPNVAGRPSDETNLASGKTRAYTIRR